MPKLSLTRQYNQCINDGEIHDDEAQREVLTALDTLKHRLENPDTKKTSIFNLLSASPSKNKIKGLYIWGGVGRGKSMLVDMFFEKVTIKQKRHVHFHAFMQNVHTRIHQLRQHPHSRKDEGDPVIILAKEIADDVRLLCFDELQATDVADATLLYRLFLELFEAGVTIVSTSNRTPQTLYTGGIQKERFNKFINLLTQNMQVLSLVSHVDYRKLHTKSLKKTYHWPLDKKAKQFVYDSLEKMDVNTHSKKGSVTIQGRKLEFRVYDGLIGRFRFSDLCEKPLGAADYLAIAEKLNMLILTAIPQFSPEKRNEAKRFVTLVDALYEHKVKLLCTAAVSPENLYPKGDGSFEFKRTVSRLLEMQSSKWLEDE